MGERPLAGLGEEIDSWHAALRRDAPRPGDDVSPLMVRALSRLARRAVVRAPGTEDDPGQTFLEVVAGRQRELVGPGPLEAARLCCEALGRVEGADRAVPALFEYVVAEADSRRAIAAGMALCRIGTPAAHARVARASVRFGDSSVFGQRMTATLAAARGGSLHVEAATEDPHVLLDQALARKRGGDAAGALLLCERALARDATFAEAHVNRGNLLLELGRAEEALDSFNRAVELAPNLLQAWAGRSSVHRRLGRAALALADLDRAVALDPATRPELYYNRANLRADAGDTEGALADLDRSIRLRATPAALINRAVLRMRRGEQTQALADLDRAIDQDPYSAAAWVNRGKLHRDLGELSQAMSDVERALALDPTLVSGWVNLGLVRQDLGNHRAAIDDFSRALELRPGYAPALSGRATSLQQIGEQERAEADYEQALAVSDDPGTRLNRAGFREGRGDVRGARADLEAAVAAAPTWIEARARLAYLLAMTTEPRLALEHLRVVLQAEPDRATAWVCRALANAKLGEREPARAALARALELAPGDPTLCLEAHFVLEVLGEDDEARALAAEVVRLHPEDALANANLALSLALVGDDAGALAAARRAGALGPNDPRVWQCVGVASLAQGDLDAATLAFRQQVELQPLRADAHERLGHALALRGDLTGALASLGEAARLGRAYAWLWCALLGGAPPGPAPDDREDTLEAWALRLQRGAIDPDALIARARRDALPGLAIGPAQLHAGLAHERAGDLARARACYEACLAKGRRIQVDRHHAARRLAALKAR